MQQSFGQKPDRLLHDRAFYKFLIFLLTIVVSLAAAFYLIPDSFWRNADVDAVREVILSFAPQAELAFVGFQLLQVAMMVIPDVLSVAGGYIWGVGEGFLLSISGILLGTILVFYVSRFFGYEFVSHYIKADKMNKFTSVMQSSKGTVGLFLLCLFPLIPKDFLVHIAGLTPIRPLKFFVVYGLCRCPVTFFWSWMGSSAQERDYLQMALIGSVMIVLIVAVWLAKVYYDKKHRPSDEQQKS